MLNWRDHDNDDGCVIPKAAARKTVPLDALCIYCIRESLRPGNVKVFCGGTQACVTEIESPLNIEQQKTSKIELDGAFASSFAFTFPRRFFSVFLIFFGYAMR